MVAVGVGVGGGSQCENVILYLSPCNDAQLSTVTVQINHVTGSRYESAS